MPRTRPAHQPRSPRSARPVRLALVAGALATLPALVVVPTARADQASADPSVTTVDRPHEISVDPGWTGPADPVRSRPSAGLTAAAAGASYPLDATFRLHSLPGADRTLFIDLDGADVSGTRWNTATTDGHPLLGAGTQPGWSLDASPAFSDTERAAIQDIWAAVAEDYAPFAIDVTTEQPSADRLDRSSATDQQYGVTALVSGSRATGALRSTADDVLCPTGCGGLSYIDVFDAYLGGAGTPHSAFQPAFVFPEQLQDDPHAIADAVAHEVGHNLGLSHDGLTSGAAYFTGQGLWGPIMGAPSGYPLTQWSRGQYARANQTQDDLAIIGTATGAPLRADDAPGSATAASALPAPSGTPAATGIISTAADVDVWSLGTCTGPVTVTATPAAAFSPDLDLSLTLLRPDGTVLKGPVDPASSATSRTVAAGLGASASYDAGAGAAVLLAVDGVGAGSPTATGYSDYGSLGRYLVTTSGSCAGASGAPGTPTAVTATASGTSATVGWGAPATSGTSPVASYTVTASPAPTGGAERVVTAPSTSTTWTGLVPGQTYTFTVSARNATASGPGSSTTATVAPLVPGAPTTVRASVTADGTVVATWSPPTTTGGADVSAYRVSVPGQVDEEVTASTGGLRITGLTRGTPLVISVQARNVAGLGPAASATVTVAGTPATDATPALALLSRPLITGAPRVGHKLRVDPGRWSRPATLSYQWLVDGRAVRGATGSTWRPRAAQAGHRIGVRLTASAPGAAPVTVALRAVRVRR